MFVLYIFQQQERGKLMYEHTCLAAARTGSDYDAAGLVVVDDFLLSFGEFYWNTGLFLSNVKYLRECFCKILPPVLRDYDKQYPEFSVETENAYMKESFSSYPNISVDFGVLDKPSNVYMMKCDFGWADLGTWHSIYEAMQKSSDDNVVVDSDVMMENCHNNVIKLPKGKLAVLNGLDGFIVAENDNVLLICKKEDSSALVRKYVNEVQMKKGDEFV